VLTWSLDRRPAAPLVVLTRSAERSAQISDQPLYDVRGGVTRTWRTVPLVNGVWAGRTGAHGPALARIRVDGLDGGVGIVGGSDTPQSDDAYDFDATDYRLVALVSDFARAHEVPAARIEPHVVYDGAAGPGRLLVVVLHLPDGSAFQTAYTQDRFPDGTAYHDRPVNGRPIAATAADRHALVYVERGVDGADRSPVRVVAPGAAFVRVVGQVQPGSSPWVIAEIPVGRDGYGSRDLPGALAWRTPGWRVITYDAKGRELGQWPLTGEHDDDPLDVSPR
jgi:hypothetical protein